jgi:UDP-N-acetylmuramoyl-tripeptide--D-alanyl-D-alanine ligase
MSWTLAETAVLAGGRLSEPSQGGRPFSAEELSLDSRTLRGGEFFVALRGDRHDGHDHLAEAAERGAIGALVDRPLARKGFPEIIVKDSLLGWQTWSAAHRHRLTLPVIGLTGSSGKTTSKDLLAHLLSGIGPVHATCGNHNNQVGVPWTLLGITEAHRFAVIEMGMNHPGEIARLSMLAAPRAALITDVGTAHVGLLGSREAILQAKLEILEGMPRSSPLVLPYDPWILARLPERVKDHPLRTFGLDPRADFHPAGPIEWSLAATAFDCAPVGPLRLSILGSGAVLSALAALAAVSALGLDAVRLASRLESAPRHPMRMEPRLLDGVQWLLDCYNASPESTRLAIGFLREVPHRGRRMLVLGELGELGEHSAAIHQDLGRRSGAIETVLFVGEGAKEALRANREAALPSATAAWVASPEDAAEWLRPRLRQDDLVLLKGSRRIALERIVPRLYPDLAPGGIPGGGGDASLGKRPREGR